MQFSRRLDSLMKVYPPVTEKQLQLFYALYQAFHELRRYHTRPLRLNWGPENVILEKGIFRTSISMLGFFWGEI